MFLKNGAKVILIYVLAKKVHSIYHLDKKSKKTITELLLFVYFCYK